MTTLQARSTDESIPLELVVNREGIGVGGLRCTVAVRRVDAPSEYLDWSDGSFKTSCWATRDRLLADLGFGFYQVRLQIASLGFAKESLPVSLVAEYCTYAGGVTKQATDDIIIE